MSKAAVVPAPRGASGQTRARMLAEWDEDDVAPARQPVRPVARRARVRLRHAVVVVLFFAMVALPVIGFAVYLFSRAQPQYASVVAFNVRSEEGTNPAATLLGFQMDGSTETDAEILNAFITSQPLVEQIDAELDLRALYSAPEQDWLFRFHPEGTIEDLVRYWNRMVAVGFRGDKGLIEVEVRAFDPVTAQSVAERILANSEEMINRLSAEAEEDATRYARAELDRAEAQLRQARQALTTYRTDNQIVDPEAVVAAQMGLLNSLQQQLADTLIEFDMLRDVTRTGDPRLEQAQRRIEVIETRIREEKRKLADVAAARAVGARPVTEIVGRFEELRVDLEFAEQSYLAARAAFDGALEKARRNSRYLATYKPPSRAESAQYPEKFTLLGITGLFLFLIWAVFSLVLYSIRDRR